MGIFPGKKIQVMGISLLPMIKLLFEDRGYFFFFGNIWALKINIDFFKKEKIYVFVRFLVLAFENIMFLFIIFDKIIIFCLNQNCYFQKPLP